MAGENDTGRNDRLTEQINRLTRDLRDEGVSPRRDLWGDIDEAISKAEANQIRPVARRRWDWPQIAAIAAMITFLVLAGRWGQQHKSTGTGPLKDVGLEVVADLAAVAPEAAGLEVIGRALSELNLALAEDPDNLSLSNLALMLHQSRGRILRQNTDPRLTGS